MDNDEVEMSNMNILFFFKQKTAYEMRISDWSSDVCSSDLHEAASIETEIRFEQGVQALQQQAASGQQGKRRGNLECDQPPAQSGAPRAECEGARAARQITVTAAAPNQPQRTQRQQPEQQAGAEHPQRHGHTTPNHRPRT